jgi:hypothetical protein
MTPDDIMAGARTVAQVAVHFDELKQASLARQARGVTTARGYFTPTEDEEGRHMLVSYWQARNALLDLVTTFRHDRHLPDELRPAAFLVAYAAAVLLVDAARFLHESFKDNPIVRAKLNEPEPHFGVPPGVYDAVQSSLTSPRHAWHLYHAMRYLDEHGAELRRLADDPALAPAHAVIERLGHRVRVPAARYAKARARLHLRQTVAGLPRDLVTRAMYGLMKLSGNLVADRYTRWRHQPCVPEAVRAELCGLLLPGDVFICRKEHALTNYFLPGYWPHAALHLGDAAALRRMGLEDHAQVRPRWARLLAGDTSEPRRVLEAQRDGVWIRPLSSPLRSDALVLLRPRLDADQIAEALARGLFHEGKPYDFDFDFTRSDRLVCTEVVYRSYEGVGGIQFALKRRTGRMTLAAEDLIEMALVRDGFEPVAVYAPRFSTRLVAGPAADDVLRATRGAAAMQGGREAMEAIDA